MPSQKPKVQGVIDDDLYSEFLAYKESINAISDSAALNSLLHEFFKGSPKTPTVTPLNSDTLKNLTNAIESINNQVIPNIKGDILALIDKVNKQQEIIDYLLSRDEEQPTYKSDNRDKSNHQALGEVINSDIDDNNDNESKQDIRNGEVIAFGNGDISNGQDTKDSPGCEVIAGDKGDILEKENILNKPQSKDITSDTGDNENSPLDITSEQVMEQSLEKVQPSKQQSWDEANNLYNKAGLFLNDLPLNSDNHDIYSSERTSQVIVGDKDDNRADTEDIASQDIAGDNRDIFPSDITSTSSNQNIISDNGDNLEQSLQKKSYSEAIAIIKQRVLRERVSQKDVIAFLNSEGYPTATGVGEWTAVKVSKEVSRLKRSRK